MSLRGRARPLRPALRHSRTRLLLFILIETAAVVEKKAGRDRDRCRSRQSIFLSSARRTWRDRSPRPRGCPACEHRDVVSLGERRSLSSHPHRRTPSPEVIIARALGRAPRMRARLVLLGVLLVCTSVSMRFLPPDQSNFSSHLLILKFSLAGDQLVVVSANVF